MAEEATDIEETTDTGETRGFSNFLSPEGLVMMSLAVFVDVGEFIAGFFPGIGTVISTILDIAALLIIGGWLFFRSQMKGTEAPELPKKKGEIRKLVKSVGKAEKRIGKAAKWVKRLKWLRPVLIVLELFPLFEAMPDFIFGWTILVYLTLRYD